MGKYTGANISLYAVIFVPIYTNFPAFEMMGGDSNLASSYNYSSTSLMNFLLIQQEMLGEQYRTVPDCQWYSDTNFFLLGGRRLGYTVNSELTDIGRGSWDSHTA